MKGTVFRMSRLIWEKGGASLQNALMSQAAAFNTTPGVLRDSSRSMTEPQTSPGDE